MIGQAGPIPTIGRADDAILFHDAAGPIAGRAMAAYVRVLQRQLPPGSVLVNLCRDPCRFAGVLLAGLLADRPSLLLGDRSPDALRRLRQDHPDALLIGDRNDDAIGPDLLVPPPDAHAQAGALPAIDPGRLAAIVYTSGSTGAPTPHRKCWGALACRSHAAGLQFDLSGHDPPSLLGTVPVQHMYGFETMALLPLHAACATGGAPSFYPADIAHALRALPAPRILVTTPLQLAALQRADLPMPALRAVISATAPLDAAIARDAARAWNTTIFEIYGATEAGSIASRPAGADAAWSLYPGVTLRQHAAGAIDVHAPGTEPTRLSDRLDLQPDGQFHLLGRDGDLIKLGGRRASLAGLNRILLEVPGVMDGAFLPPEDGDAHPAARMRVFVVAPGLDPETILQALRARIDPAFLPRRVVSLAALPRNEVGKLPRAAWPDLRAGPA